jgi:hypothetical protein
MIRIISIVLGGFLFALCIYYFILVYKNNRRNRPR